MAYSELVKNFEKVRDYMRQFYIYGFKSRSQFSGKSARSYDDERRRIEGWLGAHMGFAQTPEGKNVFLSVDSRSNRRNPFYRAWKTKSFTDGDITLHFILLDVLHNPEIRKTLAELVTQIDGYLRDFPEPMTFDESTIRKKLKEYTDLGLIVAEKQGKRVFYSRTAPTELSDLTDVIDFFSEAAPCGVVGSYIRDRLEEGEGLFAFKHHYMTQAMDSGVLEQLFRAMREQRYITVFNLGKGGRACRTLRLVPLKIYISAQNGRQNLIAWHEHGNRLNAYRLDYLSDVQLQEVCPRFQELRQGLNRVEGHIWGVNCRFSLKRLERVEFDLEILPQENHVLQRLYREKRCGQVEKIDDTHYRFVAEVFDTNEMMPWVRTFTCHITRLSFSNRTVENRFKQDLEDMYRLYGLEGGQQG